ncbi:cytochrome P450 20A1-like [Babylonia areolata]|uniref:cytochrome P450 20A1-like n=1 Tax=Babylonia areolata TaxID=304850 RepID=UPI003FD1D7E3
MSWLAIALGVGIAVTFIGLVFLILWLFPDESRKLSVPGVEPTSNQYGNLTDIIKAGSFHEYLSDLHKNFGPIVSFWWTSMPTVSIASPELFKQQMDLFDHPVDLYIMFETLLSQNSIKFSNGKEGKARRAAYDKVFEFDKLSMYCKTLQAIAEEVSGKWEKAYEDDHFPLTEHMSHFAAKAVLMGLLGEAVATDKDIATYRRNYKIIWDDLEKRWIDPVNPLDNNPRAMNFFKALVTLRDVAERAIEARKAKLSDDEDFLLIDAIMNYHAADDKRVADIMTYTMGGYSTTANLLAWCIYYLCTHEEVQEKVYTEIITVLGPSEPGTVQNMGKLRYLRQVLDETLRCSQLITFAVRSSDKETHLDGHKIPSGTPVIQALGVTMRDENIWPAPSVFDPDRFSEKRSKGRPSIAFSPFGFAGRRQCPGYRFAYLEASIMLVTALRKVKFLLVPGQDVMPVYGFVTHPKEEIWYRVSKRL